MEFIRGRVTLATTAGVLRNGYPKPCINTFSYYRSTLKRCTLLRRVIRLVLISMSVCGTTGKGKADERQLELALTWNRSDVAEDKIFNQDIDCTPGIVCIHLVIVQS